MARQRGDFSQGLPFLWGSWIFRSELSRLWDCATVMEDFLKLKLNEALTTKTEELAAALMERVLLEADPSVGQDLYPIVDEAAEELLEVSTYYPYILRKSLFLLIYARFERYMIDLCESLQKRRGLEVPLQSLKGNGIRRAKEYLVTQVGLDFPENSDEWHNAIFYNGLRNHLAHGDRSIDHLRESENVRHQDIAEEIVNRGLSDASGAEVILTAEFIKEVLVNFAELSKLLDDAIERLPD